jgi:hypothetical protein
MFTNWRTFGTTVALTWRMETSGESQAAPSTMSDVAEDKEGADRRSLAAAAFHSRSAAAACSS